MYVFVCNRDNDAMCFKTGMVISLSSKKLTNKLKWIHVRFGSEEYHMFMRHGLFQAIPCPIQAREYLRPVARGRIN